jgi:hypothetical protein
LILIALAGFAAGTHELICGTFMPPMRYLPKFSIPSTT